MAKPSALWDPVKQPRPPPPSPFQQAHLCVTAPLAPFFFLIICRCENRNKWRAQHPDPFTAVRRGGAAKHCCHRSISVPVYFTGIPSDTSSNALKTLSSTPAAPRGVLLGIKPAQRSSGGDTQSGFAASNERLARSACGRLAQGTLGLVCSEAARRRSRANATPPAADRSRANHCMCAGARAVGQTGAHQLLVTDQRRFTRETKAKVQSEDRQLTAGPTNGLLLHFCFHSLPRPPLSRRVFDQGG